MEKKAYHKIIFIALPFIYFIFLFTIPLKLISQTLESDIDSLKKLLKTAHEDSNKVLILRDLSWNYKSTDNKKAMYYALQCLDLANKVGNKLYIGKAYSNLGSCYYNQGDYFNAENYYMQALKIGEEIQNKTLIVGCLNSIGNVYGDKSDYAKSINYYLKALKLSEETGEIDRIGHILVNIGTCYQELKNREMALKYYSKALPLLQESKNKYALSTCYANIAEIHIEKNELNEAENNFIKSREIYDELGDTLGISHSYYSLGMIYNERKMYEKALKYFFTALKFGKQLNDKAWVAEYLISIGQIYRKIGNYSKALNFLNQSLDLSKVLSSKFLIKEIHRELAETYHKMSEQSISQDSIIKYLKKAYNHYEKYSIFKDSTFSEESGKQIAEMQTKYDTEKKDSEIKLLNKDKEIQESNLRKQRILIFSFLAGFIIILVFSVFLYRLFLQKKKANIIIAGKNQSLEIAYSEINNQKEEITAQRDEIENKSYILSEQNKLLFEQKQEITDSINYAKRIQTAVLPTGEYANNILGEHFILFKPKDIVSGDFYWGMRINEWLIITVADCTGHGVPGAFMSMLGVSFLNEIVRKKEVTKASEVLNYLRESIIEALQQKGTLGEQKDGMDMTLIVINVETLEMQFAGANNPCWIITQFDNLPAGRQGLKMNQFGNKISDKLASGQPFSSFQINTTCPDSSGFPNLIELKPDKMPIGIHENMQPFTNQTYQLQKGNLIYLMSDGYQDQFGGPKLKKFLSKNLKQLLTANCRLPMADQKELLENSLNSWKGDSGQIDDITIMGIRI